MRWFILAVMLLGGCTIAGAPRSADSTTCGDWLDRMRPDERGSMAGAMLQGLWNGSGENVEPDTGVVDAFADGIGAVCRAETTSTVSSVAATVYDALPDVRPDSPTGAAPDPSKRPLSQPEQPVTIRIGGRDRAQVEITEVELKDSFFGADGDEVAGPEHVFVQVYLRYRSLSDGFRYGPTDWQPIVDGVRGGSVATLTNGPEPWLADGTLDAGEEDGGYLVFEVPLEGEFVLSYAGLGAGDPPVDVVLRDAPRAF